MSLERTINDTDSPIEDTLKDQDGNAVDITGNNDVEFHLLRPDGTTVSDDKNGNVTVDDASAGQVSYALQTGDLDQTGSYYYEWEVEFGDGGIETWPSTGKGESLTVRDEIA